MKELNYQHWNYSINSYQLWFVLVNTPVVIFIDNDKNLVKVGSDLFSN